MGRHAYRGRTPVTRMFIRASHTTSAVRLALWLGGGLSAVLRHVIMLALVLALSQAASRVARNSTPPLPSDERVAEERVIRSEVILHALCTG